MGQEKNSASQKSIIHDLPNEFEGGGEVKGYSFKLAFAKDQFYVFHVESEGKYHHEVFKRKLTPLCLDFEKRLFSENEFKVRYPKSNDFGIWAWTTKSIDRAMKIVERESMEVEQCED